MHQQKIKELNDFIDLDTWLLVTYWFRNFIVNYMLIDTRYLVVNYKYPFS